MLPLTAMRARHPARLSIARPTDFLLDSQAWPLLVAARQSGDDTLIEQAKDVLRAIPTLG